MLAIIWGYDSVTNTTMSHTIFIFILVVLTMLSGCATAVHSTVTHPNSEKSLRVEGTGDSVNAALHDSFKVAIEKTVGVLLINNTSAVNDDILNNEILQYSAGYINNFNIVSTHQRQNKVVVIADVEVLTSKIQNRIIASTKNNNNSSVGKIQTKVDTYIHQKKNLHRIIDNFAKEYNHHAIQVAYHGVDIEYVNDDKVDLKFKYNLSWNLHWLAGLDEFLNSVKDSNVKTKQSKSVVVFQVDNRRYLKALNWQLHYFNDYNSGDSIHTMVTRTDMLIGLYEKNNDVPVYCEKIRADWLKYRLYDVNHEETYGLRTITFNSFNENKRTLEFRLKSNHILLKNIDNLSIKLANKQLCNIKD